MLWRGFVCWLVPANAIHAYLALRAEDANPAERGHCSARGRRMYSVNGVRSEVSNMLYREEVP
jgi:hypothetical protein